MAVTDGKISAPISAKDPYTCMGVTPTANGYDVGYICSNAHGKVNKWSKNKPYDNSKLSPLTDADKKGTAGQQNAGIYYGLKVSTEVGQWLQLHDVTYNYVGNPKGGNSPYRLTDFVGYDHNAKPTINGKVPTSAYINVERSLMCTVEYDYSGSNTTGVDIAEIINSDSDATKFDSYYPCILLGNYARALFNDHTGTQTPIKYNNAWYTKFYCNLTGYPSLGTGQKKCTLFFVRNLYQEGIYDIRNWQNMSGTVQARQAFAIPNAIAIMCNLQNYNQYPILKITAAIRETNGISLAWAFEGAEPTTNVTYEIRMTQPGQGSQTMTYVAGGINQIYVRFTWAQLGFMTAPTNPVHVSGIVYTNNTQVSAFDFTNI